MARRNHFVLTAMAALPLVAGCQTNEQTGTLLGAGGGAAVGAGIGSAFGGRNGALIGALLGGAVGGFAGSQIGQQLDQRDRERAEAATRQALVSRPNSPVAWASDQNRGVRGSARVTNVQRQPSGGECRTVRETAYVKGQEVVQNANYCQTAGGEWMPHA